MSVRSSVILSSLIAVLLLAAIGGAYFTLINNYLPDYFQTRILPGLLHDAGISGFSGTVRNVGMFSADLGSLAIGEAAAPALKCRSVKVRYSITSLIPNFPAKLREIELNGVYLRCSIAGDKLIINDIDLEKFTAMFKERMFYPDGSTRKVSIEKIVISDAVLEMDLQGKKYLLPFELMLEPRTADWSLLNITLKVSWRGREISVATMLNFTGKTVDAEFSANVALARASELFEYLKIIRLPKNFELGGDAAIKGRFSFEFNPFKVLSFVFDGNSDNCTMKIDRLIFCSELRPDGSSQPLNFKFSKDSLKYLLSVSDFRSSSPLPLSFRETKCEFASPDDMIDFNGKMLLEPAKILPALKYKIRPLTESVMARSFNVSVCGRTGEWKLSTQMLSPSSPAVTASPDNCEFFMKYEQMFIFASAGKISVDGAGKGFSGEIGLGCTLSNINLSGAGRTVYADTASFESKMKLQCPDRDVVPKTSDVSFGVRVPAASFAGRGWDFTMNDLVSNLNLGFEDGRNIPVKIWGSLSCGKLAGMAEGCRLDVAKFSAAADIENPRGAGLYSGSSELAFSRFDIAADDRRLNVRNGSLKNILKIEQRKNRQWELRSFSGRNIMEKIDFSDKNIKLAADKLENVCELEFGESYVLNYKKLTGRLAHLNVASGDAGFEAWNGVLDGVFDRGPMSVRNKKNLKEQLTFDKVSFSNKSFNIVSAAARLTLEGLIRNSRLVPETLDSRLDLNAITLNVREVETKIDELKMVSKLVFDQKLSWPSAFVRLDSDIDLSGLQGQSGSMKFEAPGLTAKTEFSRDGAVSGFMPRTFSGKLSVKDLSGTACDSDFESESFLMNWESKRDEYGVFAVRPVFKINGLKIRGDEFTADCPAVAMTGQYDGETFAGKAGLTGASADFPDRQIALKGIDIRIPVSLPDMKAASPGELKVNSFIWRELDYGSTVAEIEFGDAEVAFQGSYSCRPLPSAHLTYTGRLAYPPEPVKLEMEYSLPEFRMPAEFDLESFFPVFAGFDFQGLLSSKGMVKVDGGAVQGSAMVKARDAQLNFPGGTLKGVDFDCAFDDLFNLRSAPHQVINFKGLKYGRYELGEGLARLQFESPSELLIENCRFKWLGGMVSSEDAFRLGTDQGPGAIAFSARGVQLPEMLRFCGFSQVEAAGALSGSIPVVRNNDTLSIDKALLYTMPGQGGVIRLAGLDKLRIAGTKDKELEHSGFVEAALEDFQYNWLRLTIEEKANALFAGIQIQGRPQRPVPFKYEAGKLIPLPESVKQENTGELIIDGKFSMPAEKPE